MKPIARCIQTIMLCLCMVGSAFADDPAIRAHTPPQSPFHPTGPESLEWPRPFIEYEGRTTVSAKYSFVFDEENGFEQNPHLFLMPDAASQSKLPYLTRRVHESDGDSRTVERTEKAAEIWVENVAEAARALLGKQLALDSSR